MSTNEFGYTVWGADVVRIAEPVTARMPNSMAPRARSIARNNGVTLTIEGRLVTALVHRGETASVAHIEFRPMSAATAVVLTNFLSTELLSTDGEPHADIHRMAADAGHPTRPVLDNCDCSCPARTTMCVHVLAALYALAAQVDTDPQIVLRIQDFGVGAPEPERTERSPHWTPLTAVDPATYFG